MKNVGNLELTVINTRNPSSEDELQKCESAYQLWKKAWQGTFRELNVGKSLFSDDFLDRELGGLFLGNEAVGFLLYNWFEINRSYHCEHSYFENYPSELMEELLISGYKKIMVISYMTLKDDWRKPFTDLPISELLTSFAVKRFVESEAQVLVGYFRNDRKTNEMFYRHGGIPLIKDIKRYNVAVDFASITKAAATSSTFPGVADIANRLWENRNKNSLRRTEYEELPRSVHESFGRLHSVSSMGK